MKIYLKDIVTLGNGIAGFLSVVALMSPLVPDAWRFEIASALIFVGYACDACDGLVARLTRRYNRFGGELDQVCDMITYSVAPSFLVYHAFAQIAPMPPVLAPMREWIAVVLGAMPVSFGAIRAARFNVRRMECPGYWIGVPRPVLALYFVALLNSSLFRVGAGSPLSYALTALAAAMVVVLCFLHLSFLPHVNHHRDRFRPPIVRFGAFWFLAGLPITAVVGFAIGYPRLFFDMALLDLSAYLFLAPLKYPDDEMEQVRSFVARWKAEEKAEEEAFAASSAGRR